jgi:hypothetical protein
MSSKHNSLTNLVVERRGKFMYSQQCLLHTYVEDHDMADEEENEFEYRRGPGILVEDTSFPRTMTFSQQELLSDTYDW